MRKGPAASRLRPGISRPPARFAQPPARLRLGASRRRRRHGAEPGAGSLLRLGQHAHRHGRGESEGHVGGNVPATASLRRARRSAPRALSPPWATGPLPCRLPPRRRSWSRRPLVPARGGGPAQRAGRLRPEGAPSARAPGRMSPNCHEGRVASAQKGGRAPGAWLSAGTGLDLPGRAGTRLSGTDRGRMVSHRVLFVGPLILDFIDSREFSPQVFLPWV